ncbi:MAG: condensation domain-containing protein [Bacteroidota bacterium]
MSKPKIEAIYPLGYMQQVLLLHSLYEKVDQGLLNVTCTLSGHLDIDIFQQSLNQVVNRHHALRTSIHWKDIDKPVQVIHPPSAFLFEELDWSDKTPEVQEKAFEELQQTVKSNGVDLSKPPASRIHLIQLSKERYWLLWTCHHILLDGWSAAIIIKDLFEIYGGRVKGQVAQLPALPSHKALRSHLQKLETGEAELFWRETLSGYTPISIQNGSGQASKNFDAHAIHLDNERTSNLVDFARKNRVTIGTVIQVIWGLTLNAINGTDDIVFGTTVSGRSMDFPNIDRLSGLFMNVLPARTNIEKAGNVGSWLAAFQLQQNKARTFEHITLDQISSWLKFPGHTPLLESLIVFENFPWEDIKSGGITVSDFLGGITSTYPLTAIVIPGENMKIDLRFDKNSLSRAHINFIVETFTTLSSEIVRLGTESLSTLVGKIPSFSNPNRPEASSDNDMAKQTDASLKYAPPQNNVELQLTRIWESVFGISPIGINDNFFELGGNSLLAVRLFAKIESETGKNLPPVSLLNHPTIAEQANLFSSSTEQSWSCLVPLRANGRKKPIFCLHAGGGHIMFYNDMTRHMDADRPVYAVQPSGIDGSSEMHNSIEEMAAFYLKEIKAVQPQGPYALLGTCFSNPICIEMAKMIESEGDSLSALIIIDSPPQQPQWQPWTLKRKVKFWANKLVSGEIKTVFSRFVTKSKEVKETTLDPEKSKQLRNLKKLLDAFHEIYFKYEWKPFPGKITLIRSTEFHMDGENPEQVDEWKKYVVEENLDIHVVEGGHLTLFEEPDVVNLSAKLDECLNALHP